MNGRDIQENQFESDRTLRDYVDVILRRTWVVAVILAIVLIITIIFIYTRTPLYTSVATVELEEKGKAKDKDSIYGNAEYDQFKGYMSTQIEILKSRHLAEELVSRLNLVQDPEFSSKAHSWVSAIGTWFVGLFSGDGESTNGGDGEEARRESIIKSILGRIKVKTVKTSNLLQVSMDATDPRVAAKLLQNYINIYLEKNLEKRRNESQQAAVWLQEELTSVEKKLRNAQVALLDFVVDHGIVDSKEGGLSQVINMLNKKMEGHIKSEEARAKVESLEDQDTTDESVLLPKDVANNEYIGKLKQELAMMESEYTQMRGLYSPSYPKLRMLQKKIQFLTDRINTMEKNMVTAAVSSAKKEEKLLEKSYESGKKEVARVRSLEAEYSSLKKDVETNSEFEKILLKEYKQMDIRARTISNDVKIVDRPTVPRSPSWPKKKLFLLVGILMGLVAGVAGAFVIDRIDNTLQSPREIDLELGTKRLGVVPDVAKLPGSTDLTVQNSPFEFLAYNAPRSPISDAIRNIQTSIYLTNPEHPTQCLAVSSATPSEGKTLIAISIATVLASDKTKRVVVVDADLRRPRLHKVFESSEPGIGFTSAFNGASADLSTIVRPYRKVPGLFYVSAGQVPSDPVSLLQSARTKEVFSYLRETFDYVVIDCPPILGMADTPIICLNTDGLVMVARQGHVGRDELREAISIISSAKSCPILGVVMNMAYAPGASRYAYRYSGRYYYSNYYQKYSS